MTFVGLTSLRLIMTCAVRHAIGAAEEKENLSFKVHQLQLVGRCYLLLPKLNSAQVQVLARKLADEGYLVQFSRVLVARSRGRSIYVDRSGICWSSFDMADAVLPAIPEVLSCPKQRIPLDELEAMYFTAARSQGKTTVRLSTRMESSSLWDGLRASGECGLAPDERAVTIFLMRWAGGACRMLADFPRVRSVTRTCGRRRYFESSFRAVEAESTLRAVGEKASRNSYLPRDGVLRFSGTLTPPHEEAVGLFEGLGEWCSFAPG